MRTLRRSLSVVLSVSLGALVLIVVAPVAEADASPGVHITEFAYGGKAAGAAGGDGEYTELTNTGTTPVDLSGWKLETSTAATATATNGLLLTPLGSLAPGESAVVSDLTATEFSAEWGLKTSVKVLNNGGAHTLKNGSSIHVYDPSGAEVDSVNFAANFLTKGQSAWVDAAHVGAMSGTTGWTVSTSGDAEESWTSTKAAVGSPGASRLGTVKPADVRTGAAGGAPEAPCDTEDSGTAPGTVPPGAVGWPGSAATGTIDSQCAWVTTESGQDLSGLAFDPTDPDVLYAVKNKSHVYRLVRSGSTWIKDTANGWSTGKDLRFPVAAADAAAGLPDTEGLTVGPDGMLYVTTERDNNDKNVPLDSILRFDPTFTATTLVASDQWDLTSDLGFTAADANLGFEGVAYVPDSFLTRAGFRTDDGAPYVPSSYPTKAVAGLFLGAVEKTGHLRAYVLNADHGFTRVADIDTGMVGVMDASFDPDLGRVWAHCDNTCGNATTLLEVAASGHFAVERTLLAPTSLPNYNLEGFAVAPVSTMTGGARQVLWADDGNRFGHSLRAGTLDVDLQLSQSLTPDPAISGTAVSGGTLMANVGTWDAGVVTHYAWKDGSTVLGTDAPLAAIDPRLAGKTLTLTVTGTRSGFVSTSRTATITVAPAVLAAPTAAPVQVGSIQSSRPMISGRVRVGKRVTAQVGSWTANGRPVALTYVWRANGKVVHGKTGTSLRLTRKLAGKRLTVTVTGSATGCPTVVQKSEPRRVKR